MSKLNFFKSIKKKVSLIVAAVFAISSLYMSMSPIHVFAATMNASANPRTSANNGSGINWTSPESLASGAFPYASVTLDNSSSSAFLKGTNYNFSTIPAGSIINSITVTINHLAGTNSVDGISGIFSDSGVYLVNKQGVNVGTNKKNSSNWSSYYEIFNYTWTAAELTTAGITLSDIKDPNFGVALSVNSNSADMHTASVTQMIIKVSYTGDTTPPVISSVTGNPTSWQNTDVTLTVNAADVPNGTDPVSGIPATGAYSFDNGLTWQDSNQKTFSSNQTVGIRVRDAAGNTSYTLAVVGRTQVMQPYLVTISKIDKVPPILTLSQSSSGAADGSITITPTATDTGGSGINVTSYKYAEGNQNAAYFANAGTPFTSSFNVSTSGTYTVYVKDIAGNEQVATTTVSIINSYTVTFVDYDGTVLKTESVNYGGTATAPLNPTRTGYIFTGWDKTFNNITGDTTVTAQYNINRYTVTFVDYDGTVLKTESVNYGGAATAPLNPTRTGYTFTGWDKAFNNVTSDTTVTAQYNINSYTVTFTDYDGTVLKAESVNYGGAATAPSNPTRTGYIFSGWDKNYKNITSDLTVNSTWSLIAGLTINVTAINGTVTQNAATYAYGDTAVLTAVANSSYKFVSWTDNTGKVLSTNPTYGFVITQNTVLTANFAINTAAPIYVTAVSAGYNSIKVSWNTITWASGYEIYRSKSSNGTYSLMATTASTSYTNTGLSIGNTYYYKVRAFINTGNTRVYSNYSSVVSAKPVLAAPVNVTAVSTGYSSIRISWGSVSGARGYYVYRSTSYNGTYLLVAATSSTSYTSTGLTTGNTYYYKVRAYTITGNTRFYSDYSSVVSAKPVLATLTSLKAAKLGSTSIRLSRGSVSGASGYEVYRATSSTGPYSLLTTTRYQSYTNSGLRTRITYYYKVRAYRIVGKTKIYSNWSTVVNVKL